MPVSEPRSGASGKSELMLLGLLAVLWGAWYPLVKVEVATIPPITLVAIQVSAASAILWTVVWLRGYEVPRSARIWRMLFVQSSLNSILPWSLIAWGQQFVDSGVASILNSTAPIFVLLITMVWTRHEALSTGKRLGAILGFGGVVLIIGLDALKGLADLSFGQLAILLATVCYALAVIYGRRFSDLPPEVTTAGTMGCAAICLVPAGLLVEKPLSLHPTWPSMAALAALAVFCTAGGHTIFFRLVNTIGSMGTSSVGYLRVGVAVLLGVVLLGEPLTWTVCAGLATVVVGVAAMHGSTRSAEFSTLEG
jgi:drug/metabolite transporter (DMT)-like permease